MKPLFAFASFIGSHFFLFISPSYSSFLTPQPSIQFNREVIQDVVKPNLPANTSPQVYVSEFPRLLNQPRSSIPNDLLKPNRYHVKSLKNYLDKIPRRIAWILLSRNRVPIELSLQFEKKITLFPTSKTSLDYLKKLYKAHPDLKKELVIVQPIDIESLEKQIQNNHLQIILDIEYEEHLRL